MKPSLLLTGSQGFVGKHIVEDSVFQQYHLLTPVRSDLELSDTDAVNQYFNKMSHIDYIVHAANIGGMRNFKQSEEHCLYENVMAFRNLFQYHANVKRFIQLGSGAEYRKPLHKPNINENNIGDYLPQDAYGLSKFFCSNMIEHSMENNVVNLRIFGLFGPYEDYTVRFISYAILQSLRDLPIVVNQNAEFDYLYIKDFLKIVDYFIQNSAPYKSYNVTSGKPITLLELAYIINELTQNKRDIIVKNAVVNQSYTGSNQRLLDFLPRDFLFTDIRDAIKELITWYSSHFTLLEIQ